MKAKTLPLRFSKNDHIIWLPVKTYNLSINQARELMTKLVKNFTGKNHLNVIKNINDSKVALEFANLAISRTKPETILKYLLECYDYEKLKDHKLFKGYEISKYSSVIHKTSKSEIFFERLKTSNTLDPLDRMYNKFLSIKAIFHFGVANNNIQIMDEIARYVFDTANIFLNFFQKDSNFFKNIMAFYNI